MKTTKIICLLTISFVISTVSYGQGRHGGGHHGGHKHHHGGHKHKGTVVIKRSPFRPHKIIVYHPVWHPKHTFNRRWVFFPKHNIYWDNWRNHYMFWNGTTWVSQTTPPPAAANITLANEKNYELKEEDDDVDDVYASNENHKTEYKSE